MFRQPQKGGKTPAPPLKPDDPQFTEKLIATKGKELKDACEALTHDLYKDKDDGPFWAERLKLGSTRKARQVQVVALATKMVVSIVDSRKELGNKPIQFKATAATDIVTLQAERTRFFKNFSEDLDTWEKIGREIVTRIKVLERLASADSLPYLTYLLWHCLDEAAKQHPQRYEQSVKTMLELFPQKEQRSLKPQFDKLLDMLTSIYQFRQALQEIEEVGLYVYRLNQQQLGKNRRIIFGDQWQTRIGMNDAPRITGFSDACKDYRAHFEKFLLQHNLKQCKAFETIHDLDALLCREQKPEFSPLCKDLPEEIQEAILGWLAGAIERITQPLAQTLMKSREDLRAQILQNLGSAVKLAPNPQGFDSEDNFMAFYMHVRNEQVLKDTLWFAQAVFLALQAQDQSLHMVKKVSAEDFSSYMSAPVQLSSEPESHADVIAREKRHRYEQEQVLRAARQQQATLAGAQAFTEQLRLQNEAKHQEDDLVKKEALLKNVKALSSKQRRVLIPFLDPQIDPHKKFKESAICPLLIKIDFLETTTDGYKTKNAYKGASTDRAHDDLLDGNFCRDLRRILGELGINKEVLEGLNKEVRANYTAS